MIFANLTNGTLLKPINDTVTKSHFTEKLEKLSNMSLNNFIEQTISGLLQVCFKIIIALIIFFIGRWLIKRTIKFIKKIMIKRDVDMSLRSFLLNLINITMALILIFIIIGILGINTSSLVALFASAGVAIGLALSGTLQNFAGGVMILLFRPYRVGDFIEAQGQTGTVKEIQIFNTVLNTPDNKTIIIPNGGLSTGIINNYSKEGKRRIDWQFGIAYGDDYDKAKKTITDILKSEPHLIHDIEPFIALISLGDSSVNIVVRAWANSSDYWDIFFSVNEKVYKRFPKAGLNIPFPQLDVHIQSTIEK